MAQLVVGTKVTLEIIAQVQSFLSGGKGCHTRVINKPTVDDEVLYHEEIRKGVTIGYATHTFNLDRVTLNGKKITAILIRDMWTDDTGGDGEVTKGGVGHDNVTIVVTSKWLRGFNFHVTVFGR